MQETTTQFDGKNYLLSATRLSVLSESLNDAKILSERLTDEASRGYYLGRATALEFALGMLQDPPIIHPDYCYGSGETNHD